MPAALSADMLPGDTRDRDCTPDLAEALWPLTGRSLSVASGNFNRADVAAIQ